jgi:hypothetical protein
VLFESKKLSINLSPDFIIILIQQILPLANTPISNFIGSKYSELLNLEVEQQV